VRLLYYCRLQTTYTFLQLCPCFNHTFHHTTPVNRVKFALLLNQFRNYLEAKYIFKLFARARARPGPYSRTLSIIIKNAHRQHTTKPNQTKPNQASMNSHHHKHTVASTGTNYLLATAFTLEYLAIGRKGITFAGKRIMGNVSNTRLFWCFDICHQQHFRTCIRKFDLYSKRISVRN
jgi:hypothetical protein